MASTRITRTPGSSGNRNKWTMSMWLKRSGMGSTNRIFGVYQNASYSTEAYFNGSNALVFFDYYNGSYNGRIITNRLFRDSSAWYHIVINWDKDNGTGADKLILWVNGVRDNDLATDTQPSNASTWNVDGQLHEIGSFNNGDFYNGCMSHIHFCDGYSYPASTFGETDATTGEWKPILSPSVSYGTNGFHLKFENSTNMDLDSSSNALTFTTNGNLTQTEDSPSNVFNTLNPLCKGSYTTLSNGNLTTAGNSASDNGTAVANIPLAFSGKYYWEVKLTQYVSGYPLIGLFLDWESVSQGDMNGGGSHFMGSDDVYVKGNSDTTIYSADGNITGQTGYADGDIVMFAADMDNGALYIGRNGTWQNSGDPTSGASKTGKIVNLDTTKQHMMAVHDYNGSDTDWNFGNGYFGTTAVSSAGTNASGIGIFEYDVPTGFTAISTKGLNE